MRTAVAARDVDAEALPIPRHGLEALAPGDSMRLGGIHPEGGRSRFWLVGTVPDTNGRPLGYMVQQRTAASGG